MKIKNELERQREIEEMRMTKWRTDTIYKPSDLNTHDPHEMYRWQDEEVNAPAWVWALRALGALGFITGIYCLVFLGMLL
tara:strand:+ start:326 stop:565 length:240 start_codon:yes stop_codon:yes gene_type:complete